MTFKKSLFDKINNAISPAIRKLQDLHIDLLGTKTTLLRISSSYNNLMEDESYTLQQQVIANAIIEYPFQDIEIFAQKDQASSLEVDSFSILDILPIRVIVPIESSNNSGITTVNFDENDLIVDVFYDHDDNKIPVILQSPVLKGTFKGKHIIQKTYEANLYRGILEDDIQTIVDDYISNLGVPVISSSSPSNGDSGVVVTTDISIVFNVSMSQNSVEDNITVSPDFDYTTSWDDDSTTITINPSADLSSGIAHTIQIAIGTESTYYVPSETLQSIQFIT